MRKAITVTVIACALLSALILTEMVLVLTADVAIEEQTIEYVACRELGIKAENVKLQEIEMVQKSYYQLHEYILEADGIQYAVMTKQIGKKVLRVIV